MIQEKSQIQHLQEQITALKDQLRTLQSEAVPEPVADHILSQLDGTPVRLSELFGDRNELLVVHNMGRGCVYCTVWADGFTGDYPHLNDRCAFVLCSGDAPEVAREFSQSRNWNFPVVSGHGSDFATAMGFQLENGDLWPGVSSFVKNEDGSIARKGFMHFGPGDDFCAVWPLFDLLDKGVNDWTPKYKY